MAARELNPWRQGSLVDPQDAFAAGWPGADGSCHMLVATHDCDLQSAHECRIELVPVREIGACDGKNTHGKNPRLLHLPDALGPGRAIAIDLSEKVTVERKSVVGLAPQDSLNDPDRRLVSGWLGDRYARAPFPDSFDRRLRKARTVDSGKLGHAVPSQLKKDRNLHNELMKVFAADGIPIEGIYIELDEKGELDVEIQYRAKVAVVGKSGPSIDEDGQLGVSTALAKKIKSLFELASWDVDVGEVVLATSFGTTEKEFSLFQAKKSLKWHLEWLSATDEE